MIQSVGQISRTLGVELHQVLYAVRSRGIEPVGKVGSANAFDEAAVERIRQALGEIGAGAKGRRLARRHRRPQPFRQARKKPGAAPERT